MNKHYITEAGTDLILDTGILIGTVQDQYIEYTDPNGVTGSFDASLYSSYSAIAELTGTYLLKYTLKTTDITVSGTWKFQAYVAAIDGTWWGETVKYDIYGKFE